MGKPPVEIAGLEELIKRFEDVREELFSKAMFSEIGLFMIARIQARTAKGVGSDGQRFDPYSKRYALFRKKKGHPTNKVNLFFSGSMMSSMTHSSDDKKVRLFFQPTKDASGTSNPLKAFFLHQDRRFFAMSSSDVKGIMDIVRRYSRETLEGE